MKLVDISDSALFGDPDARNPTEQSGLRSYFVRPPGYRNIVDGKKTIIVGRKGTGKTAIRTKLLENSRNLVVIDVDPLLPKHNLFTIYAREIESSKDPSYATYEVVWRSYIIATILGHLVDKGVMGFGKKAAAEKFIASAHGAEQAKSLWSRIKEISAGIPNIASTAVKIDAQSIQKAIPTELEVRKLCRAIELACKRRKKRILVLVDRVDQQLDEPKTGPLFREYSKYLGGVCLAASRLASSIDPSMATIYVFVREDLLEQFRPMLHNATEFDGLVYRLPWRGDRLMDVLAMRIASATGQKYDPTRHYKEKRYDFESDRLLYHVFEKIRLDGLRTWNYLLLHTHMNPRDVIVACNYWRIQAEASCKKRIDGNAINRGMYEYSRHKYGDLVATNLWRVTAFRQLIDSFRGKKPPFGRQEILGHLSKTIKKYGIRDLADPTGEEGGTPEHILQILYKCGFLVAPTPSGSNLSFISYHLRPYFKCQNSEKWLVHPAFLRELESIPDKFSVSIYLRS